MRILDRMVRRSSYSGSMFKNRIRQRLDAEPVIWLTTVRPDGQPQTSPVWFLLEAEEILLYSLAGTARVHNIEKNRRVALNLDGDGEGGNILTLEGVARLDPDAPRASQHPAYVGKYLDFMKQNGWSPDDFSRLYPTAIRIEVTRIRSW